MQLLKVAFVSFGTLIACMIGFLMIKGIPEPLHGYYPEEPEDLPPRLERLNGCKNCSVHQTDFWLIETQREELMFPYSRTLESILYFHPNARVHVYSNTIVESTLDYLRRKDYDVQLHRFDLAKISSEIPELDEWYKKGAWKEDTFFQTNLSNLLRLYLLWHYGGIYLDTDIIVVKPLDGFKNTLGWQENFAEVNTAVLCFEPNHPLGVAFLKAFAQSYTPSQWGQNGVRRLNVVLGVHKTESENINRGMHDDISDISEDERWRLSVTHPKWRPKISNVTIVPAQYFYPIDYHSWHSLKSFEKQSPEEHLEIYERVRDHSYALHWWNKMFDWNGEDKNRVIPRGTILHMLFYCFERCYRYPWELDFAKTSAKQGGTTSDVTLFNRYLEYHYSKTEIIVISLIFGISSGVFTTAMVVVPCIYCLCFMMNSHRDRR